MKRHTGQSIILLMAILVACLFFSGTSAKKIEKLGLQLGLAVRGQLKDPGQSRETLKQPEEQPQQPQREQQQESVQGQPEQKQPEQKQPEQKQPEQKQPEQKQPEQKQPEQRRPEQKQPEQRRPEHKPERKQPERQQSQTSEQGQEQQQKRPERSEPGRKRQNEQNQLQPERQQGQVEQKQPEERQSQVEQKQQPQSQTTEQGQANQSEQQQTPEQGQQQAGAQQTAMVQQKVTVARQCNNVNDWSRAIANGQIAPWTYVGGQEVKYNGHVYRATSGGQEVPGTTKCTAAQNCPGVQWILVGKCSSCGHIDSQCSECVANKCIQCEDGYQLNLKKNACTAAAAAAAATHTSICHGIANWSSSIANGQVAPWTYKGGDLVQHNGHKFQALWGGQEVPGTHTCTTQLACSNNGWQWILLGHC